MKRTLLISVAAVALAAGSTVALSQGSGGGAGSSGASGAGGGNPPMANPAPSGGAGASGGAGVTAPSAQDSTPGTKGAPGAKGAQDRTAPQTQKSTQAPQGGLAPAARQSQDDKSGQAPSTRQSQGEQPTKSQQQTQSPSTGGSKQGAAERPMTSKSVSLTTEQKTTIRRTVLTGSAPRVTNVNFDIRVGTVVPRTVRIAPLPTTLVEIEPEWRGYMYFVHNDEIIVVEPGTLRIVAVIEV